MRRLLATTDTAMLEYLRAALAARGIAAFVRNAVNAGAAAGELPPAVAPPELWLVNDDDRTAAERLVAGVREELRAPGGEPWRCPRCGETLEPQFAVCWACGTERPAQE